MESITSYNTIPILILKVKYMYEAFCRLRPGISLLALYGTLHQLRRMSIYETFCKKQYAVLFATDIAARGLGK